MQERMADPAPQLRVLAAVLRPGEPVHHGVVAQRLHQDVDRDAQYHHAERQRPGLAAQGVQVGFALIVQAGVGMAGLPAGGLITAVERIDQKLLQLVLHLFEVAVVGQPDFRRLAAVAQLKPDALGRHIVDKASARRGLDMAITLTIALPS